MKIRIITDSASDMKSSENKMLSVLPLTIHFGDDEFRDGITLSHNEFYEKLIESDIMPVTSMVPPYDFEQAIKQAHSNGEVAIVITISSKLSGTYQSAVIASDNFAKDVYVIDSYSVCVGERILVEYALLLAEQGISPEEIVKKLEQKKQDIRVIALLDTLEYLKRGGRISKTAGFVGEILSIKPVIAIENGEISVLGKARGSKNGNNLLTSTIEKVGGMDYDMPLALGYSGLSDSLMQKYITDSSNLWKDAAKELPVYTVGATIGTHAGSGAIAFAFYKK